MRHQGKSCAAGYQGGGPAEDRLTEAWFRDFARTVGNARVVIAYEPDSIGTIECLAPNRRAARERLLRYGVDVLSQLPNATVYLEATASDWKPVTFTARMLNSLGIAKVRGFMLNATHYDWTINNINYGHAVSRLVGGKPFVVNTSHNGRGPVHYKDPRGRRINVYCHPQMRGLGPTPRTDTGYRQVDAFLYINRPGYSGGACNGGPPKVGSWWPERALMMGRYSTEWVAPPKTHWHGLERRVSLCRLGAPTRGTKEYSPPDPSKRCLESRAGRRRSALPRRRRAERRRRAGGPARSDRADREDGRPLTFGALRRARVASAGDSLALHGLAQLRLAKWSGPHGRGATASRTARASGSLTSRVVLLHGRRLWGVDDLRAGIET